MFPSDNTHDIFCLADHACNLIYHIGNSHLKVKPSSLFKVILHQFWVKKCFPWKFNLEYGGTFTKLFMNVSSRNIFPTIRNLQIRVHVYRPRHFCGDWLTFGCFVPIMTSWRNIKQSWMLRKHAHISDNDYWGICLLHVVWTNFICNYSYVVHTEYFFFHQLNSAHER